MIPQHTLELGSGNQKCGHQLAVDFYFIGYIYKSELHVLFLKCQHLKGVRHHNIYIYLQLKLNVRCQFKYLNELRFSKFTWKCMDKTV